MATPNRKQFASVVADAFFSQYGPAERRSAVMNNPVIVYDTDDNSFGWCSSLTPLDENEICVLELSDDMFGVSSDDITERELATYLAKDADTMWSEVMSIIDGSEDE
jgi:hypothetical protein